MSPQGVPVAPFSRWSSQHDRCLCLCDTWKALEHDAEIAIRSSARSPPLVDWICHCCSRWVTPGCSEQIDSEVSVGLHVPLTRAAILCSRKHYVAGWGDNYKSSVNSEYGRSFLAMSHCKAIARLIDSSSLDITPNNPATLGSSNGVSVRPWKANAAWFPTDKSSDSQFR